MAGVQKKSLGYSLVKAGDMSDEGVSRVLYAIFDNARRDYIYDKPGCNKDEIEYFVKSPWAQNLLFNQNVDGPSIIENWKEQRNYVLWRRRMGCPSCKKKKGTCIHRDSDEHYTALKSCELKTEGTCQTSTK